MDVFADGFTYATTSPAGIKLDVITRLLIGDESHVSFYKRNQKTTIDNCDITMTTETIVYVNADQEGTINLLGIPGISDNHSLELKKGWNALCFTLSAYGDINEGVQGGTASASVEDKPFNWTADYM